ncbi:MAG: hypothetical protein SVY15_03975 [Halobacteriota archaeon]|nr:hypothetical protein [Halobacteriota archaeon]
MSFVDRLKGKSKEEKEIEREIRYRKAKATLKSYIEKLARLQTMVYDQGKQAAKLGDEEFLKRQALKYLALQEKKKKAQKMLLLMEEVKVQREMVKVSGEFVNFAKDISDSIFEAPDTNKIAGMQIELEKAMTKAETIDEALSVAIDMTSEGILTSESFSDANVEEIMKTMEGEVETEEKGLDDRISKGVKDVEEMMRR